MSVINQLLLDLEKRRASAAERLALPLHVRVLPDGDRAVHWGRIAAGGGVAVAVLAAGWVLLALDTEPPPPPAPRSGPEAAIERVVTASAGVATDVSSGGGVEAPSPEVSAFRLSFELAAPPAEFTPDRAAEQTQTTAIPAARVLRSRATDPTETARPSAAARAKAAAGTAAGRPQIQKHERQPTPRELADNEYRAATASLHQGRLAEAQEGYQAALNLYPEHHGARQGLVGSLLRGKQLGEAENVLQEGVRLAPAQIGFTTTLARLQVDRGDNAQGIATLQSGLAYAQGSADYVAFLAALLQRQGRHEEAVEHFQAALRAKPAPGVWWLGLGMSLQAVNRPAAAQDAYRHARAAGNLHPDLAALAEQRLKQLQ